MKYVLQILIMFSFSFSVNALQVEEGYPLIDKEYPTEIADFALPGDFEKIPIHKTLQCVANKVTYSLLADIGYKHNNANPGDSLPYEVGWQSTETI